MGSCLSTSDTPEKHHPPATASNTTTGRSKDNQNTHAITTTNRGNSTSQTLNTSATTTTNNNNNNENKKLANEPHQKSGQPHPSSANPATSTTDNNTSSTLVSSDAGGIIDKNPSDKEFKILLLGSGESGKSTILKQMKILHQNGYTKEELLDYKPFVFRNVLDCAKAIAKCYQDYNYPISMDVALVHQTVGTVVKNGVALPNDADNSDNDDDFDDTVHPLTSEAIQYILDATVSSDPNQLFDETLCASIASLWKANSTKNLLIVHKDDFYLMDSAKYFFQNLKRISLKNYMPDVTDVLRTRKKTSGIFETRFNMGSSKIHMVDVGGQRSERKKWIHCFDNVTIIIFCVSLSEYDQTLLEEKSQNRLEESLVLFDSVVNSRWFSRTSIVLFLNKIDVFAEKLQHSPLEKYFPDYTGGNDITKAAKYVLWRFKQVNRSKLNMFPHITQATDTKNIKVVFAAVEETILQNSLKDSGIITIN